MTIEALNQKFAIPGMVEFSPGKGELPVAVLTNQYATAAISLYGAHVLSFIPKSGKDILWMSEKSSFEEGKPIRGGIPVCFPWFGPHATDNQKPQHGFARLLNWEVKETSTVPGNPVKLILQLTDSPATKELWPFSFRAEITVVVDTKLALTLSCTNTGTETFEYTDALHTYLNVSDIAGINIEGLQGADYLEPSAVAAKQQEEKLLSISKEENRRYINHTADSILYDKGFKRKIHVSKTGSKVTVVWNPGAITAKTIGDMADDGYKTFICIEATNAFSDIIKLSPGENYSVSTTLSEEPNLI